MKTVSEIRRENLRSLEKEAGSQIALADRLGKAKEQINALLRSKAMGPRLAREIEELLDKPRGWMDTDHTARPHLSLVQPGLKYDELSPRDIKGSVPLISYVQAGNWSETIDIYEPGYGERVIPTTVPHSRLTFALRVEGFSMTLPEGVEGRSFPPGVIIYVDPERECRPRDFVVAKIKSGRNTYDMATFKQLMLEEGRPVLVPLNTNRVEYPIIRDEFEIIGRVIDFGGGGL